MKKINLLLLLALIVATQLTIAQDAHFTQYESTAMGFNPSHTGMLYKGDYRVCTQYRNQWGTLGSKYSTLAVGYDMPFEDRWGFGGYIIDADGARIINNFTFALSSAYQIMDPKQKKHSLTVGLHGGFIVKNTNENELVFNSQYVYGTYDPDLPSGENLSRYSIIMPEINWGINYTMVDDAQRFRPFGGFSIFHVTGPKETFYKQKDSRLARRWVLDGGCKIEINKQAMVTPIFLAMFQRNAKEYVVGLDGFYQLNEVYSFTGCIRWRVHDAIMPMLGIFYKNVTYKLSYDVNISGLKEYTGGHGAIEFSIILINRKGNSIWF